MHVSEEKAKSEEKTNLLKRQEQMFWECTYADDRGLGSQTAREPSRAAARSANHVSP
jgi:hypothetical protein